MSSTLRSSENDDETYPHFEGVAWRPIDVKADGSCSPLPNKKNTDVMWVKMAYHIGSKVYNVVNMTQAYQCFVQLKVFDNTGQLRGPHARCNYPECVRWQYSKKLLPHKRPACKHIRAAVRWHVKLTRRVRRLAHGYSKG